MKKLLGIVTVALAAAACAFALAACGPSVEMQKVEMGDYSFEVPAAWGELKQTYTDMELYHIGADENNPQMTITRSALDPADGTPAEGMQKVLDMWFNDSEAAKHLDVVDFKVGDYPARGGVVDFGTGSATYQIMFTPDGVDFVEFTILLASPDDKDGIAMGKTIQDSIAVPDLS